MLNDLLQQNAMRVSRRALFGSAASGLGTLALSSLLQKETLAGDGDSTSQAKGGIPGLPHFAPKAKRVILLWQGGGPSHVDLFDEKPVLAEKQGQDIPDSVRGSTRLSTMSSGYAKWPCVGAIKPHKSYGNCGMRMSEMMSHVGQWADELTLVRSMHTEAVNHAPGVTFFMTGSQVPGRPSMGAWATYGLGSMTSELPAFVVMTSTDQGRTCGQLFYDYYWGSGFVPSKYQGVRFRSEGEPVLYLANPLGCPATCGATCSTTLRN